MIGKLQTVIDTISDGWAAFIHSDKICLLTDYYSSSATPYRAI